MWCDMGSPVVGRELPKFQDLTQSKVFNNFLCQNLLMEAPVAQAKKISQPSLANLISGSLYSYFNKYYGTKDNEPGYTLAPYDALKYIQEFGDSSVTEGGMDHLVYFLMATLQGLNLESNM